MTHPARAPLWKALALVLTGLVLALQPHAAAAQGGFHQGRRVLHVDSYHPGNEWNDRIGAAIRAELEPQGIELRTVYLDAKRRTAIDQRAEAAARAMEEIRSFDPEVVIVSDDDAAAEVLVPYLRNASLPVVFCGLNWDASAYGLPFTNTTGMVEVSPIPQIVRLLRPYAKGTRLGVIAEDTMTKRKEIHYHEKLFGIRYDRTYLVSTFADWSEAFRRAQTEVDMLIVLGVGAVTDWDAAAASALAETESRIPAGTDFAWLTGVTLFGVAKVPEEQGRWAARAALRIMDGVPPSRIPPTYNRESEFIFNPRVGRTMGISDPPALAKLVP